MSDTKEKQAGQRKAAIKDDFVTGAGLTKGNSEFDTHFNTKYADGVDLAGLQTMLEQTIAGEVRFDRGSKALYSTDASNYRQIPLGVVVPKTAEDIIQTIKACHRYNVPVLSRGGGTSLAGQGTNVAVVMDMSKYYNNILHIDAERRLVTVQPGIVLDEMRGATQRQSGLTFGPDPATHTHCTLGGMLGNNSCGIHSVMAALKGGGARTSDNTESLIILTYDGLKMKVGPTSDEEYEQIQRAGGRKAEIYASLRQLRDKYAGLIREKFPNIPRRVSGYNLPDLLPENGFNIARALVGSESTCVTILEATLQLIEAPKVKSLVVLGFEDIYAAGHAVPEILKFKPIAVEGIDHLLIGYMRKKGFHESDIPLLPDGKGWLLVEFGGKDKADSDAQAQHMIDALRQKDNSPSVHMYDDEQEEKKLWEIRESGLGATAWVPGEPMSVPGWEDAAVDPGNVGEYLRELRELFNKYGYNPSLYGHFGQGCIHCRVEFDLFTAKGLEEYHEFTVAASHLVVKYGGSLSGEHGDGQSRGPLLNIMFGDELVQAFHEFKRIWDPQWRMNPGKIIDSYGQLADLRINNNYNPPQLKTHFQFPDDNFDFSKATLRCVGVGKCRRHEGGTMCPSYMVTREEEDSTRGRARVLFEMLQSNEIKDGWRDEKVKESLDLCLACKGCKGDCPVNVDMATYKSEFLSHYYAGRIRPRTAYAFGLIFWWSRLANKIPWLVNFFLQTPVLSKISKAVAGVAAQRKMPEFAEISFKDWFRNRPLKNNFGREKVILWADTFNNYFLPETLVAGVEVLEAAGFEVVTPKRSLCCGRPLYDFGMLTLAKRMLQEIMDTLRDEIELDIPIVGLEPSCVAVFRDELKGLFPHSRDAKRLSDNVFTLAEFLEKKVPDFSIPALKRKAVVHGHCHHKAIMHMHCEHDLMKKIKLDYTMLDSGCCGMAGYFGYEKGKHYDVSIKAGERVLLPAVRDAGEETIIVADGFSCREQIEQQTNRKGLHLAQVLQMALREDSSYAATVLPEKKYVDGMKLKNPQRRRNIAVFGIAVVAGLATVWLIKNRKR